MRLARIIHTPISLKAAEIEFTLQILAEGYVIESDLSSGWIDNDGPCDALVQANIEKAL